MFGEPHIAVWQHVPVEKLNNVPFGAGGLPPITAICRSILSAKPMRAAGRRRQPSSGALLIFLAVCYWSLRCSDRRRHVLIRYAVPARKRNAQDLSLLRHADSGATKMHSLKPAE
jgi:hypothetical protein